MLETTFSPLRLAAWVLLALGGVLLLTLLWRIVRLLWQRFRPLNVWARYAEESSPFRRRRSAARAWLGGILLLLLGLLLGGAGWGLLQLEDAMQAYIPFPSDRVAAQVQCLPAKDAQAAAAMTCSLVVDDPAYTETVTLEGVRWGLEGELLVWDPALERYGLRSGYRLLRLIGYDAEEQIKEASEVPHAPGLPLPLIQLGNRLPFVQAHRVTVSDEVVADRFYELVISREGVSLREWGSMPP